MPPKPGTPSTRAECAIVELKTQHSDGSQPALARTSALPACANCGHGLTGEYCAACGQNRKDSRVSLQRWIAEAAAELFSLDGRLLLSLRTLFLQPGALTRDWSEGRRARYAHPLRLYMAALAIFFGISFGVGFPDQLIPRSGALSTSGFQAYDAAVRAFQDHVRWLLTALLAAMVPVVALTLQVALSR
jgi:hypothetical protein